MISCRCLSNVLQAEPISFLWALTDSTGAFYWTKFRFEIQFRKFHVPNGTILWLRLHRPYPGHRAFGYCSCRAGYKRAVRGTTIWSNGKEHFLPTGQSGPCTFKFRSEQTKAVRSIGCTNQNFRNFGSIRKCPMNYWKYVSSFPSTDWHYWRWRF